MVNLIVNSFLINSVALLVDVALIDTEPATIVDRLALPTEKAGYVSESANGDLLIDFSELALANVTEESSLIIASEDSINDNPETLVSIECVESLTNRGLLTELANITRLDDFLTLAPIPLLAKLFFSVNLVDSEMLDSVAVMFPINNLDTVTYPTAPD